MEFTRHQDDLALARFRDNGGLSGDRLNDLVLAHLHGPQSNIEDTVVERCDLAEANLSGAQMRSATFANTNLRAWRVSGVVAERVEVYFSELNEGDWSGFTGHRIRIHGCQGMNLKCDGMKLHVARFEETPLIRASFQRSTMTRVSFSDARMGGAALDRVSFAGARLFDCSFRGANLRGASFKGALLVGCDFGETLLEAANFHGATIIAGEYPKDLDTSPEATPEF